MLKKWEQLPKQFQTPEVKEYYDILKKHRFELFVKRVFDLFFSMFLIGLLSPVLLVISILITLDSKGGVFYRQVRITTNGKEFRIFKFRTMVANADRIGTLVTTEGDRRITKIGSKLRDLRLDELPQLFNIFLGDMSFVGTRPEVKKYVEAYTPEMLATLLLPAGVTSEASICFKDEAELLKDAANADETYIKEILPKKMKYNLDAIRNFSLMGEIKTMFRTVFAVLK
ncbi:MAG: sugar transferase [Lachnospiraceae bacterium]|nr:sugar transferase [Lachnospiraceae bacterium]